MFSQWRHRTLKNRFNCFRLKFSLFGQRQNTPCFKTTQVTELGLPVIWACCQNTTSGTLSTGIRTAATVWNWSGKTLSLGALPAVLYFSSCQIFFRLFRLFLVPTICPWVSEDGIIKTWTDAVGGTWLMLRSIWLLFYFCWLQITVLKVSSIIIPVDSDVLWSHNWPGVVNR